MKYFYKVCILIIFTVYLSYPQVRIELDTSITYQQFSGWESASFITSECDSNYKYIRDAILPILIDSVGITRLRLEVRSGSEHTIDNYQRYLDAKCPSGSDTNYLKWRESRYATINDNSDTSINVNGFFFTELDKKIEQVIIPFKELLEKRGLKPFINLCYVAFTGQIKNGVYIHDNADEYAEFVLATYLHIFNKYGFTPNTWELVLEPDNVSQWSGTLLGKAIVRSAERLKKYGFTPKFIGPSNTNMTNAVKYFDDMIKVSGALDYLDEISYHRYGGVSLQSLNALADRGKQYGKKTSMLEWWFDNAKYNILHEDISIGNISSFQQATISGFFDIDLTNPKVPKINIKDITQYNRIYYTLIKPGSVRIGAVSDYNLISPVAVLNDNGLLSLIFKADIDTVIDISNLPNGNYSKITTNNKDKYFISNSYDITNHELRGINIRKGLLALRQNSTINGMTENEENVMLLSPNPAIDFIEILGVEGAVRIYDVYGRDVSSSTNRKNNPLTPFDKGELRIDVSGLAPGLYFVRIRDKVSKFIKL